MQAFAISLAMTVAMEANLEGQLTAFPPREVVKRQVVFAFTYALNLRAEFSSSVNGKAKCQWFEYQRSYIGWSWGYWGLLYMAQDKKKFNLNRRMKALSELKQALHGTHGVMPPIVAYWNFREGPPPR